MGFFNRKGYWLPVYILVTITAGAGFVLLSRGTKSLEAPSADKNEHVISDGFPPPEFPPVRSFVGFMDQELDSSLTVGAAYTIVRNGKVTYTGTYGVRKKGEVEKIDEHTVFRLASVSKGFSGALACLLERDGIFSLDDRVIDHYPGFLLKDSINTAELTLRNLLSHTSGLVPYAFDNLVEADKSLGSIIRRLHEVDISAPPGELYGYQNVLFSMLDPITRKATGVPYAVLLKEMIFRPLGMDDASAGPVDYDQKSNIASPHVRGRNGYIPLHPHTGYYNVMPAAGINASISDMGQWLLALLGEMPDQFPDTVRNQLSKPVIYTPLKARYTRNWRPFRERYYSLGWRVYHYRGRTIVYHGGYIRGYRAEIGYCPDEKTGIAFLQNSPNGLASNCVPTFFDMIIDHKETEKEVNDVLDSAPGKVIIAE